MQTPVADFIRRYAQSGTIRFHMPGHKGHGAIGCEPFDITEISGADELYAPEGILARSETNASTLFDSARTVYSTEGSSQCVRAMVYLAAARAKAQMSSGKVPSGENAGKYSGMCGKNAGKSGNSSGKSGENVPVIVAARNVHSSFVYAAALCDVKIVWLWPDDESGSEHTRRSLCTCPVSPQHLRAVLEHLPEAPAAVYVTSPDYLGGMMDIAALADVCRQFHTPLLVDNAHGAYLRFLTPSQHPLNLGADMCCDSAHKTFPVLTGGAYLHIGHNAPAYFRENVKTAMALFGSTSPSWLTLMSLDLCNQYLDGTTGKNCSEENYRVHLRNMIQRLDAIRETLRRRHWHVEYTDPLRLTLCGDTACMAQRLHTARIEWEYLDRDYLVLMFTPDNSPDELNRLVCALGECPSVTFLPPCVPAGYCETVLSPREAVFAPCERIPVTEACGRICAAPAVSCPPAVPVAVAGERISHQAVNLFTYCGIKYVNVVR